MVSHLRRLVGSSDPLRLSIYASSLCSILHQEGRPSSRYLQATKRGASLSILAKAITKLLSLSHNVCIHRHAERNLILQPPALPLVSLSLGLKALCAAGLDLVPHHTLLLRPHRCITKQKFLHSWRVPRYEVLTSSIRSRRRLLVAPQPRHCLAYTLGVTSPVA